MNIDTPFMAPPNILPNTTVPLARPEPVGLPGGGGTAAVTEFERPVLELEQTQPEREDAGQQSGSEGSLERGDDELVAQLRFDMARDDAMDNNPQSADEPTQPVDAAGVEPTITADVGQLPLGNSLEAQIESRFANDPVGAAEARISELV
jgi:hypothetical protein